jgi:hypothetical protein
MGVPEIFKEWFFLEIFDWAKHSAIGQATLVGAAMSGISQFKKLFRALSIKWRHRTQGFFIACVLFSLLSASSFLYDRWSIDPRTVPASEVDRFTTALGKYDPTQTITVFCFKGDPASCAIAGRYQDWLADHWSAERGPNFESDTLCTPDLVNRVWVYTQFTHDRPSGAITLHKALDAAGMNPGYRLNGAMDQNHFGFGVGCSQ